MNFAISCSSRLVFNFIIFIFSSFILFYDKSEKKAGREELRKFFGPILDPFSTHFWPIILGKILPRKQPRKFGGTKTFFIPPPLPPINIKKFAGRDFAKKKFFLEIFGFPIQKIIFLEIPSTEFFYIYRG